MGAVDHDWVASATEILQASGRRAGGARSEVIAALAKETCAVSAEQIEHAVQRSGKRVGRASIYRALEALDQVGLVQRVDLGEGGARWERVGADPHHHHHHLLCRKCCEVVPFEDEGLELELHRLGDRSGFTIETHDVTLHGLCSKCAKLKR